MANRKLHIFTLLFAVLVIAGAVLLAMGSGKLSASADAVEFKSAERFGDSSFAKDLTVRVRAAEYPNIPSDGWDNYLVWTTEGSFSENGAAFNTALDRHADGKWVSDSTWDDYAVHVQVSFGSSPKLRELVAEMVRNGDASLLTKNIKLSDYMEYLPLSIMVNDEEGFIYFSTSFDPYTEETAEDRKINEWLTDYYKIRIPEDETGVLTVSVYKDDGIRYNIGYRSDKNSSLFARQDIVFGSVYGEECLVYKPAAEYLPYITGETAAISVPFKKTSTADLVPGGIIDEKTGEIQEYLSGFDADGIRKVSELAEGYAACSGGLSEDGSILFIAADNGSSTAAFVTDLKTGSVQELTLGSLKEGQQYKTYYKDNYIVVDVIGDAYYCVYPAGGSYAVQRFPQSSAYEQSAEFLEKHGAFFCTDAAWQNGRLALAGNWGDVIRNEQNGQVYTGISHRGVYVSVYYPEGLKYHEEWENSLIRSGVHYLGRKEQDKDYVKVSW